MKTKPPIKTIEVGKFYLIHDGSKAGYPGFAVRKEDKVNRNLFVMTKNDKSGNVSKQTPINGPSLRK